MRAFLRYTQKIYIYICLYVYVCKLNAMHWKFATWKICKTDKSKIDLNGACGKQSWTLNYLKLRAELKPNDDDMKNSLNASSRKKYTHIWVTVCVCAEECVLRGVKPVKQAQSPEKR